MKEAQSGGLLGKVKNGNVRETRLSWGSSNLGLRQSVSNPRIISVYITAMSLLFLGVSSFGTIFLIQPSEFNFPKHHFHDITTLLKKSLVALH